ncbi:TonB-dependent receptor [Uliginosibacterium sp. H3]|uniref:TonB-dependent receptor n=1 Tax=Uliginosibacterium silvisoli TaxID=3114758 RepID=A0ABU6K0T5_9RHOO|nr:TonB-dependent receptor [Uliginosibacterium sp. H3]
MAALLILRTLTPRLPPRLALLGGLLLAANQAMASAEKPYLADLPVVLSASRMPQPLDEAPGAITVISGDFIRSTGYRDLARVFRLVPGMQVGQERGNNYWVTYHGLGGTFPSELQVLIDGRSIYTPSVFGGVDWGALPLNIDEIDRIEVVRGPNAVTYGANAFMGAINIITRHTLQEPINLVRASVGDHGIADVDAMAHAKLGPASLRISAVSHNDEGFDNLNDSRRVDTLAARADWRLSNADELTMRLSQSSVRKGEGYALSLFDNNPERKSSSSTQTAHLNWTHAASANEEILFHYYHNREHLTDGWTTYLPPGYGYPVSHPPLNRDRRSVRNDIEGQYRVTTERRQFVWGGELRRDEIDSPFLYSAGNPPPENLARGFASLDEHLARNWQLNLGVSVEHYSNEPTHVAPRIFLNTQLSPKHSFRGGFSRAWQQPLTFQKYGDVRAYDPTTGVLLVYPNQPNPDLKQARIDSTELGYLGRFTTWQSSLDVRLFNERITNYTMMVQAPSTAVLTPYIGSSQYVNLQHPVTLRGVEYQFKAKPTAASDILFSHTLIDRPSQDGINYRIAPYTASLSWQQAWTSAWTSRLTLVRMGPLSGSDGFVPMTQYRAKPYTTADARIAWHTPLGKEMKLEIALNAINIGERHQEMPDRSEQTYLATFGDNTPANYASRMIYLTGSLQF